MQVQERLRHHVDVLAELIGERNTSHPSGLDAARTFLRRELSAMGHAVVDQTFAVHNRSAINLEVILPGEKTNRSTLIIGAHYDSAEGTPGADDNASAVAVLLEIARTFAVRPPKRPVQLVFFDCEEPPDFSVGEMGSQHHAGELARTGVPVMGMVCLESIGFFASVARPEIRLPWPLRWLNKITHERHIVIVSDLRSLGFGIRFVTKFLTSGFFPFLPAALPVSWVSDISLSDHRAYWEQGFPALMVTDTAHLRNPNYHQTTDRLATLDLTRMARLCVQLQRTLRRLAG